MAVSTFSGLRAPVVRRPISTTSGNTGGNVLSKAIQNPVAPLADPFTPLEARTVIPETTVNTYGGYGSASAQQEAADEQAYWDDQIAAADQSLGRLGSQRDVGYSNLDNSYTSGLSSLRNSQASAQNQYDTTRNRTVQDNIQTKSSIDDGVRSQLTGLQRLLASRGAGAGTAATILAPRAAGLQGNQRRQQVQQTYGRNINDLDNNWRNTSTQFESAFGQLDTDRTNKRNELDANFAQTEADLLNAKSDAALQRAQAGGQTYTQARAARTPYTSRINTLLSQIDSLGKNATFQPKSVSYADPTLQAYNYDQFTSPQMNSGVNPALAGGTGAYWNLLQSDDRKRQLQPGY